MRRLLHQTVVMLPPVSLAHHHRITQPADVSTLCKHQVILLNAPVLQSALNVLDLRKIPVQNAQMDTSYKIAVQYVSATVVGTGIRIHLPIHVMMLTVE